MLQSRVHVLPCYSSIKYQIDELFDYTQHLDPLGRVRDLDLFHLLQIVNHLGGSFVPYSTMMYPSL